jgi:hypothetical protein
MSVTRRASPAASFDLNHAIIRAACILANAWFVRATKSS